MQVYLYHNFPFDESKRLKKFLKKIKNIYNLNFDLLHYLPTLFAYTISMVQVGLINQCLSVDDVRLFCVVQLSSQMVMKNCLYVAIVVETCGLPDFDIDWDSAQCPTFTALLIPTVSMGAFHSTNLYLFSCHQTPPISIAPPLAYKPSHKPQFLQLL